MRIKKISFSSIRMSMYMDLYGRMGVCAYEMTLFLVLVFLEVVVVGK